MIMSPGFLIFVALATMAVQCSLGAVLEIAGVKLDLTPAVVAYAALNGSWQLSLLAAVIGGFLLDVLSLAPFGLSVPPLVITAMTINHFQRILYRDNGFVQFLLTAGVSLVLSFWTWFLLLMSPAPLPDTLQIWLKMLVMATMTALVAPVVFLILNRLRQARRHEPMEVETF